VGSSKNYLSLRLEYPTKKSILKDILSPDVHEFMALIEFNSTYPANTMGAYVGRNFDESKVKRGEVGLKRRPRYYMSLDEREDIIVVLKPKTDKEGRITRFKYMIGNGIHFFYGRLPDGHYKCAISVYKNDRENVTRIVVHSKGKYYEYNKDEPWTVFFALFNEISRFLRFFTTHKGEKIDISRAKLYPRWLELKIRYHERKELNVVRLIRHLGLKFPNHEEHSIRLEENPSKPGTFYLAAAIIIHPFWEDQRFYLKSYRIKGYNSPAIDLQDHPCIEIKTYWKEKRDLITDKEFKEFVKEDIEKARCFLNEVALMGLDLERDILPLYQNSEKPYGKLWKENKNLCITLNRLCSNPPLRPEEIEDKENLNILLNLGLVKKVEFNGLTFYEAAIPSYDSEISTLLKIHNDDIKPDKSLLVKIARDELTLNVVEEILKRNSVTVPLLSRILNVVRDKVRYVLEKLTKLGILKRFKGDRREIHYTFANNEVKIKIMKIFSALGFKFNYEPVLTERFFDELKKAGSKLVNAVRSILKSYDELLPIKLEMILRGLKKANDKVKDKITNFVIEKLEEKGYVTFREIMELDLVKPSKIEKIMDEICKTLNLIESRNGNRRRFVVTYTEKGLAIIEFLKNGRGLYEVPDNLRWLKPEIVGISAI